MAGTTSATINMHLNDPAAVTMTTYPVCASGPFVAVNLGQVAGLLVHDPAVLDALAVQVAAAREALTAMLTGQDPLPGADRVEAVPQVVAR